MEILAAILSGLAGLGSLVCFIIVLIHFFQSDQTGFGIVCIVLTFVCGIGVLITYVKGWMDGVGNVMLIWTACIAVGLLTNGYLSLAGR